MKSGQETPKAKSGLGEKVILPSRAIFFKKRSKRKKIMTEKNAQKVNFP